MDEEFRRWGEAYQNVLPADRDEAIEVIWNYLMEELSN